MKPFDDLIRMTENAVKYHYGYADVASLRAMVAMRPAGEVIEYHADRGTPLFDRANRVHIPVVNVPMCDFYIEGEIIPMNIGTIVEINNKKMHKVENYSILDRLHFICDVEPA